MLYSREEIRGVDIKQLMRTVGEKMQRRTRTVMELEYITQEEYKEKWGDKTRSIRKVKGCRRGENGETRHSNTC